MKFALLSAIVILHAEDETLEQTAKITIVKLSTGDTLQCLKVATAEINGVKTYTLTKTDGKKLQVLADDIQSTSEDRISVSKLPEASRKILAREVVAKANAEEQRKNDEVADQKYNKNIRVNVELQELRRKADYLIDNINNQGQAALNLKAQYEATARSCNTQIADAAAEYDSARITLATKPTLPAEEAVLTTRMRNAAATKAALETKKSQAEAAALQQGQLVESFLSKKADIEKEYRERAAAISSKYEK